MKGHTAIFLKIFLFILFSIDTKGQSNFATLAYGDLEKLNIRLPYINYYGKERMLLVYGSNHTRNVEDAQIRQIENMIGSFRPTVILYEGDGIATEKTKKETVETYFEMGLAKYIADSLSIKVVNIEPNTRDKYEYLMKRYKTDDILIATLGLQITMMQVNNDSFELLFPTMIKDIVKEGLLLNKQQQELGHFYKLFEKKFGRPFSYVNFDSRDIQAKYNRTIFNEINQEANKFRDEHIINLTKKQIDKGEKVFLIEGGWHAIVCEPVYKLIAK